MTDITVFSQPFQAEDLSWDLTEPDQGYDAGGTLAVAAFTAAQHYPNGYIPSGCVLALATGGTYQNKLVPYISGGANGAGTAVGLLKATVTVVQPNGTAKTNVGCAIRKAFVAVSQARLPFTSGNAAAGGFVDAGAKTALPLIYFDA